MTDWTYIIITVFGFSSCLSLGLAAVAIKFLESCVKDNMATRAIVNLLQENVAASGQYLQEFLSVLGLEYSPAAFYYLMNQLERRGIVKYRVEQRKLPPGESGSLTRRVYYLPERIER